jgi:hypothetical protein
LVSLIGNVNSQNYRIWSSENQHVFVENPLHPIKVGVWNVVSRRRLLIGLIFFHEPVNAAMYTGNTMALQLIQHETICSIFNNFTVTELYVICVPLNLPVCVLNPEFHICSPDSTLLDFCIFRHLQNEVFK